MIELFQKWSATQPVTRVTQNNNEPVKKSGLQKSGHSQPENFPGYIKNGVTKGYRVTCPESLQNFCNPTEKGLGYRVTNRTEPSAGENIASLFPTPGDCKSCHLLYRIYDRPKCLWGGVPRTPANGKENDCPLSDPNRNRDMDHPFETVLSSAEQWTCYCCRGRSYWINHVGRRICAVCHPPIHHIEIHHGLPPKPEPWPAGIRVIIEWLKGVELPERFILEKNGKAPFRVISNGLSWKQYLLDEADKGPGSCSNQYGRIEADLKAIYQLFGNKEIQ